MSKIAVKPTTAFTTIRRHAHADAEAERQALRGDVAEDVDEQGLLRADPARADREDVARLWLTCTSSALLQRRRNPEGA